VKTAASFQPSENRKRPWLATINGTILRGANGIGRRFATREAAERAAEAHARKGGK
jgi:hypothetical protein